MGMRIERDKRRNAVLQALGFMLALGLLLLGGVALAGPAAGAAAPTALDASLTTTATATATPVCAPVWRTISSPDPVGDDILADVAAISATDAWAVGSAYDGSGSYTTHVAHWNGSDWSVAPGTALPGSLHSIDALSSNDIWAVGARNQESLVMHWNGAQWSVVAVPDMGLERVVLYGVAALAPDNVWVVGDGGTNVTRQVFVMHWNGQTWSLVDSDVPGAEGSGLRSVAAASPSDIWAVGEYTMPGDQWTRTLTMRWNGAQWSMVTSPNIGPGGNILHGVEALSSTEAWAVGYYYQDTSCCRNTLVLRWDGTQWSHVASPNVSPEHNVLYGVTALSANDVWAVGEHGDSTGGGSLTMRWDGAGWSLVPVSPSGPDAHSLFGVAPLTGSDVWAVGQTWNSSSEGRSLIQRYSAECGTATPTPSPVVIVTPTTCVPGWQIVDSPNPPGSSRSELAAVSAASANDVWAVGHAPEFPRAALIEHWDGSAWTIAPTPPLTQAHLLDVAALVPNQAWAVGYYQPVLYGRLHPLILRWDGAQWSQVSIPIPAGPDSSGLNGVDVLAPDDAWAVGYVGLRPLAYHWDGSTWSIAQMPDPNPQGDTLRAVTMVATNDVWAIGNGSNANGTVILAMHWNGSVWSVEPVEGSENVVDRMTAVDAVASNDIWAVGWRYRDGYDSSVIMRWNGTAWQFLPEMPIGYRLLGIKAISPAEAWAVGSNGTVLRWDGSAWGQVEVPWAEPDGGWFNGIEGTGGSAGQMWIVGRQGYYSSSRTLTMRYAEACGTTTPTLTPSPVVTPTPTTCVPGWSHVPSPNVGTGANYLWSVSAVSANDVWAVGYYRDSATSNKRTLTMRWNGATWGVIASPNGNEGDNELFSVAAVAPNDVWAVGKCYTCDFLQQHLLLRWNGAQWSPAVTPTLDRATLSAVTARAANDVWAVGYVTVEARPLVLRWNGTQWSVVVTPDVTSTFLLGVTAIASNDVWVVGRGGNGTFSMHWDGLTWAVVNTPSPGTTENYLVGVAGAAPDDVWAVGYYRSGAVAHTLITHWNGTAWSVVESPSPGTYRSYLYGIVAVAPDNVWAVGGYGDGAEDPALVVRWNGTAWSMVAGPDSDADESYLHGLTAVSPTEMWAVGSDYFFDGRGNRTLTARYSGACATTTPTQIPTNTPTAISTSTSIAPTHTPAIIQTPTACSITFSDVPTSHTFHPYIICLACRNILGGYSDGTFRPQNNITRGQIAKIVANSAGFEEEPGAQMFEDVPPTHTFYAYVNRLAGRGHMGGYPCGQAGEECGPQNLPYFRPGADATRGQIAKIVSNAAGFEDPAEAQTFEDVPPTNPFYTWIERLAMRGIMGGYACGGAGEPCGVDNRPYFRPFNNATRGQTAKIVANTFFPECQD